MLFGSSGRLQPAMCQQCYPDAKIKALYQDDKQDTKNSNSPQISTGRAAPTEPICFGKMFFIKGVDQVVQGCQEE